MNQEVGLSSAMLSAGFRLGSYFEPTDAERRLANLRGVHWLLRRRRAFPARFHGFGDHFHVRRAFDPAEADNLNWATDFADFVFDAARYPVVKFDTLRYDSHWLDTAQLLALCEDAFPIAFDGVREYLRDTDPLYPDRPTDNRPPARLSRWTAHRVGYSARPL